MAPPRKYLTEEAKKKARKQVQKKGSERYNAKRALIAARRRYIAVVRQAERVGYGELLTEYERGLL